METLGLRPGHRVPEAGCGHGVAVTLIAEAVGEDGAVLANAPARHRGADAFAQRAQRLLPDHGFRVADVLRTRLGRSDAVCAAATPASR